MGVEFVYKLRCPELELYQQNDQIFPFFDKCCQSLTQIGLDLSALKLTLISFQSNCFAARIDEVEEWQCLLSLDGMAPGQAPLPSTFRLRVSPDGGLIG